VFQPVLRYYSIPKLSVLNVRLSRSWHVTRGPSRVPSATPSTYSEE
jgi:hypothetical protein